VSRAGISGTVDLNIDARGRALLFFNARAPLRRTTIAHRDRREPSRASLGLG
jgi:hypothetical protein